MFKQDFFKRERLSRCVRTCLTVSLLLMGSMFLTPEAQATITGTGTSSNPYTINNAADLTQFKGYVDAGNTTYIDTSKYWLVTADITWNNGSTDRIGYNGRPFRGHFDGGGHTINMSYLSMTNYDYVGFFGQTFTAEIKNLNLNGTYIDGRNFVGGLIGEAIGKTTIDNVHVKMTTVIDCYGYGWGGLIGAVNGAPRFPNATNPIGDEYRVDVNISASSVKATVRLRASSGSYNAGGLIGWFKQSLYGPMYQIQFAIPQDWAYGKIIDCMVNVDFSGSNDQYSIGGLIGTVEYRSNVYLKRCYANANITSLGSAKSRGRIVGYIGGDVPIASNNNTSTPCPGHLFPDYWTLGFLWLLPNSYNIQKSEVRYSMLYTPQNTSNYVGTLLGVWQSYDGGAVQGIDVWTNNTNVYDKLERANLTSGAIASNTHGNEIWGYDVSNCPQIKKNGYVVKVVKGSGINMSGTRYVNGNNHYTNADQLIYISPNPAPTSHQRVNYVFAPDYNHSAGSGNNYTATVNGNNWELYAKVNGTVSANMTNIPYPYSTTNGFDIWTRTATVSFKYDNPNNVAGKFFVFKRQSAPTSGAWSVQPFTTETAQMGATVRTVTITDNTFTAGDFSKEYEYSIGFYEGANTPSAPNDIPVNNRVVVTVNTAPSLGSWSVSTKNDTNKIDVSFTADNRFINSNDYSYTIESRVNGGAYTTWQNTQRFDGRTTPYTFSDNRSSSSCDAYQYRVVINAFGTTFTNESNNAYILGSTKFVANAPFKASKGEYANYVRLQWSVQKQPGGGAETYRVFRRVANTKTAFVELEVVNSSASTVYWSDNNALTGVFYEYKVTLYQVCSGNETEGPSVFDIGFTQAFGTVSGRVTYGSGTSVPFVNVLVRQNELQQGENQFSSLKSTGGQQKFEWLTDTAYLNPILSSKQWTVQFWINPDDRPEVNGYVFGYIGGTALMLPKTAGGKFRVNTQYGAAYYSDSFPSNHFTHVTITRSGDTVKIYTVNDENPDSIYITRTNIPYSVAGAQTPANAKISFGHAFKGYIDDVRFWNRSLGETEIKRDYARRLIGNENGLIGYWTFDDALNSYAFDMSRINTVYNGNHATTNTLTFSDVVPIETYQLALKGITDTNGNYQIGGIPYTGEGTSYSIVPSMGVHQFNPTQQLRYISPSSMVHNSTDFIDVSAFDVSGIVTYEGGNYPVEGCSFEVDDQILTTSGGQVITSGSDGTFTISVPIGYHKVRIVKQGHTFAQDGLLRDLNGNLNYNAPVNDVKFFDQTRVKLIGRIVGGKTENDKVLGFGESRNNIGVETLELNTTRMQYDFVGSANIYSDTVSHNQGQWQKSSSITDDQSIVDYTQKKITINVSPVTGEFAAMVYPEPYNIGEIRVPGANSTSLLIYDKNEMIDLSNTVVIDSLQLKTSIRTWIDSTFIANRPGVLDHWEYFEEADTVKYNADWQYYYQSTPTFGITQLVDFQPVDYFGNKNYELKDPLTGATDSLTLYNENLGTYLFGKPLFTQGTKYTWLFNAYEEYANYVSVPADTTRYPVKDGIVNLTNDIQLVPRPEELPMDSLGEALYTFYAGAPNLTTGTNNFSATLKLGSISYYWDLGSEPVTAYHLGDKSTGTDFMTTGPNQITAILRDPPGSKSKSFIEAGTSITTKSTKTIVNGMSEALNATVHAGPKVTTFVGAGLGVFAGVITEVETKVDISGGIKSEQKWTSVDEQTTKVTFTERFETSDDPEFVGHDADVFIGNSTNLLYGLTNSITIQKNYQPYGSDTAFANTTVNSTTFSISKAVSIAFGETFDTRFAFTQGEIEKIMIPKWHSGLANLLHDTGTVVNTAIIATPVYVSNLPKNDPNFGKLNTDPVFGSAAVAADAFHDGPSYTIYFPSDTNLYKLSQFLDDSVMWFNNQINGWIDVLAQNEKEKINMELLGNYSFGGGVSIQYSKSASATSNKTNTFHWMLNPTIGLATGFEVMGIGIEIAGSLEYVHEDDRSTSEEIDTTITSGFTLQEEGSTDELTVDYGMTESGTIAFKTRGGRTSCPYEDQYITKYYQPGIHILSEATMQIEVPKIRVSSNPSVLNVPSNRTASFTLSLENESETNEDIWFEVIVDESTNPDGAELKIDGGIIGNGRLFFVRAGQILQKTLTVGKGSVDTYNNIGIILRSRCQSELADTTYISVEFVPGVSDVAVTEPRNNWILNLDSKTGDTLNITLGNYDVNFPNFGYIKLEYRAVSSPVWSTIATFYPSLLYPNAQGTKEDIGSRAVISYPWKTPEPDGQYEIRATTASVNINPSDSTILGNPLSTYTTDAVAGYKDVHRPTSLGAPSPASGILGIGDELSITFNEDIQTGMLIRDNFSISGVLNAQEIAEPNVGLAFTGGSQSAHTELPIFAGGDFSIETWFKRDNGAAGTLFAFGQNDNHLSLGFDAQGKAVLKIGNETYSSVTAIVEDDTWKFIAMTFNRDSNSISVYEYEGATDNRLFTDKKLTALPETRGTLVVGNNAAGTDGFRGAVSQLHFYGIDRSEAAVTNDKSLTKSGREYGLIGYWTLDEGEGAVGKDKARSRHLTLNADWYIYPSGKGMYTNNNYFAIPTATYPLDVFSDFTLEFWFRSENPNQPNQVLFSIDKAYIGTNASNGLVLYKNDGSVIQTLSNSNLMDAKWHHIAMSVRRGGSVNVYIDGESKASFVETLLGAFTSGYYYFGAKYSAGNFYSQYFSGYFDEIRIWNSALSRDCIVLNKNSKLRGDESGLQAYYPFEAYTKLPNGLIVVIDTLYNMATTDTNSIAGTATNTSAIAMSVKDARPVENVPFTYVSSNNKIVFRIDDNYFSRVEGTTLSISVENVYDMHNNVCNAEKWTTFVRRNALLWDSDPVYLTMEEGEVKTFTARIANVGNATVSYAIENLPSWLSVNNGAGNLQALSSKELTFTVYQGINIGNYETAIGLTSGNGVTEVLPIQLKVTGQLPDWTILPEDFSNSMSIIGQIKIDDQFSTDEEDLIAAFNGEQCVGVASPKYMKEYDAYYVFMNVYGESSGNLTFNIWHAKTGRVFPQVVTTQGTPITINFTPNQLYGSMTSPVIFSTESNILQQNIALKNGWNWISFNVVNLDSANFATTFSSLGGAVEMVKYSNAYKERSSNDGSWGGSLSNVGIGKMYNTKMKSASTLKVMGAIANPAAHSITLTQGWNWIGYLPQQSMPVNDALAGLNASEGDLIKGQSSFATYTSANGWIGTLEYMQPGKGYMYQAAQTAAFNYPTIVPKTQKSSWQKSNTKWSFDETKYQSNMTMTAVLYKDAIECLTDDYEIGAFDPGGICRGSVVLEKNPANDRYYAYLTIMGNQAGDALTLKAYDAAKDTIYIIHQQISFAADEIVGNIDQPYILEIGERLGLNEHQDLFAHIEVYPNPTTGELRVTSYEGGSIEIYDVVGQCVFTTPNPSKGGESSTSAQFPSFGGAGVVIDVSHLAAGMYFLKVDNKVVRFVKE